MNDHCMSKQTIEAIDEWTFHVKTNYLSYRWMNIACQNKLFKLKMNEHSMSKQTIFAIDEWTLHVKTNYLSYRWMTIACQNKLFKL